MTDVLNVSVRNELGTGRVRRLRRSGQTPAILYGHGEANVNLAIPTAEVKAALRHGSKLVDLQGQPERKGADPGRPVGLLRGSTCCTWT